jgi:competence protein ComEA
MLLNKKLILIWYMILEICLSGLLGGCAAKDIPSLEEALEQNLKNPIDDSTEVITNEETEEAAADCTSEKQVYVYVCGSVHNPGVYMLAQESRIVAAVNAAGGFLEEAAKEAVNLAAPITDGMQIVVPSQEEFSNTKAHEQNMQDGKVNLNAAQLQELCTLSGIGEARAEAILAYRDEIGRFSSIEQLKNVAGIGESLFERIKESIYIE